MVSVLIGLMRLFSSSNGKWCGRGGVGKWHRDDWRWHAPVGTCWTWQMIPAAPVMDPACPWLVHLRFPHQMTVATHQQKETAAHFKAVQSQRKGRRKFFHLIRQRQKMFNVRIENTCKTSLTMISRETGWKYDRNSPAISHRDILMEQCLLCSVWSVAQ